MVCQSVACVIQTGVRRRGNLCVVVCWAVCGGVEVVEVVVMTTIAILTEIAMVKMTLMMIMMMT